MALDEDGGCDEGGFAYGGEVGLDVAGDVFAERLHDGRGGIVRHDDARGAKQASHDARQRRAGSQFKRVQAPRIKTDVSPKTPILLLLLIVVQGVPLNELCQQQRRIPQVMAKQTPVSLALWVSEFYEERLGKFWRGVEEGVLCVAVLVDDVVGEDYAEGCGEVVFRAVGLVAFEADAGGERCHC